MKNVTRVWTAMKVHKRDIPIIILFGLLAYSFSFILTITLRYLIVYSPAPIRDNYDIVSYILFFIRGFIWYLLYVGAVSFSYESFTKGSANITSFFKHFKDPNLLKNSIIYGIIITIIDSFPIKQLVTAYDDSYLAEFIPQASVPLLELILRFLVAFLMYRLTFVPFLMAMNGNKNIKLSFKITKRYRIVGKWWLLIDFIPSIILFLISIKIGIIFYTKIDNMAIPLFLYLSSAELIAWAFSLFFSVILPIKLFGYQICLQDMGKDYLKT